MRTNRLVPSSSVFPLQFLLGNGAGVPQLCHALPSTPLGLAGARWGSDRSSSASNTACTEGVLLALHSGLKNNLRIGCLNLNKIFPLSKAFFNFVNLQN